MPKVRFGGTAAQEFWAEVDNVRECRDCKQVKPIEEFYLDVENKFGKQRRCRDCRREHQKARTGKFLAKPANRLRFLVTGAFKRAESRGLPFDFQILAALSEDPPVKCPCCKRDLDYSLYRAEKNYSASPSLDRLDSNKGYVEGNVVVICLRCNKVKSNATEAELANVLEYVRQHKLSSSP